MTFRSIDPADISILIGTFTYSPLAGLMLTVVANLIQGFISSAQSGAIGITMHIFAASPWKAADRICAQAK